MIIVKEGEIPLRFGKGIMDMKTQFLDYSGLGEAVNLIKKYIADHKEILPYASLGSFPKIGNEDCLYIDISSGLFYRWNTNGKQYILLGGKSVKEVSIESGSTNGTIKLIVDGVKTDNIEIKGLGAAAFIDNYAGSTIPGGPAINAMDIASQTPILAVGDEQNNISVKKNTNGTFMNGEINVEVNLSVNGKALNVDGKTLTVAQSNTSDKYAMRNALDFAWYKTHWQIGNVRSNAEDSIGFGFAYSNDEGEHFIPKALLSDSGQFTVDSLKANIILGDLSGNATSASKVPWSGITGKPSTFAPSSHNHTIANITDIGKASVNFANSAGCPQGFALRQATATWGNQTGTVVTDWHTSNGGDIAFRDNKGQLNVVIDGFFYQNEGKNLVLDSGNYSNYAAAKSHTHTISNITNLQTTLDGKSNTNHTHDLNPMINTLTIGTSDPIDADYYIAQYAGGGSTTTTYHRRPHSALWNYIKSKANSVYQPKGSYAASSHTHDDRYYTESEINTKLASKSDTSHTHNYVVGSYTGNGGQQKPNYFGTNKVGFLMMNTTVNGDSNYKDWIIMDCYGGNDVGGSVALGVNRQKLAAYIMRSAAERSSWAESAELLHTLNYTSYTVTKTGSGASGTWGINITGSSGSCTGNAATASNASKVNGHTVNSDVPSGAKFTDTNTWRPLGTTADTACAGNDNRLSNARPASDVYSWAKASSKPSYSWSEITSKPSTFTPASHTHAYIPLSGGTITGSIIRSSGGSWISARNNVAVRGTATTKDSWNPVVGQATPNGYWTIGNLASNDNLAFSYTSNTNYNAGKNSAATVYLPVQEGTIITSATIGSQSVKYATSAGSAGSVAWGNVSGKPSSYTPSSHTHDDRYYTETEINTKLGAKLGAVSANGYYGMTRPDGNTSDWIRTTTAGIIPYQSGGAGGGHCGIGTSSWYFSNAYIDTVNCVNTNASGLISTSSEYRSCKGGEVNRDWRFGSATGSGDQNWFGFYDYTYGYHGGIYGPGHSLRMGGEIQSTAANGFRAVQGKYGFIIRNDGANVYFMMTGNGDPWGGWNDNYTIFTPNGEWQVKKSPYDNGMSTARGYVVVSDSNDNRVYSISNYNANYLKVRCGLNTYHCTYSNSDIRLKKNINNTSITNALSVINSIKVRQFDWKETNIHQSIGFVADELEKLDPNFSQGGGVTKDGGIDVKSVNSFYLQGYIVKALQELSSQVSDLKQENKRLKQKLNMCN